MRKRILSCFLAVVMLLSLFPLSALAAATDVSIASTAATAAEGDTFTVTLTVPPVAKKVTTVELRINFDNSLFEVTKYEPPAVDGATRTASPVANANNEGYVSVSWESTAYDNTLDFSSGITLEAEFQVKAGASGSGVFSADTTHCDVSWFDDQDTFDFVNQINVPEDAKVTVTIAAAHTHVLVKTEAVAADCETPGNSEYWTCSGCGKFFSDAAGTTEIAENSWIIPALGHDYGKATYTWAADNKTVTAKVVCSHDASHFIEETADTSYTETTPATESAEGVGTYTASFKDTHFTAQTKDVTIPKLTHTHVLTKTDAVAADCENPGNSEYWTCSGCGKFFSDAAGTTEIAENSWIIPALGHDYGKATYDWAADNKTVTAKVVCSRNASHVIEETAESSYSETTPATESAEGVGTYSASFKDTHFTAQTKDVTIPKLAHTHVLTKTEAVAADCENPGNSEYWTCSGCGKFFSEAAGTAEITENSWVIPATDHAYGTPEYTWADDNKTVTAKVVCSHDASHVIEETASTTYTETTPATESAEGVGTYSASFKDTHFTAQTKDVTIPKLAHTHVLVKTEAVAADCENPGNSEYWICSACGKFFSDAAGTAEITENSWVIPALKHDYGEWVVTIPATETEAGEETRTCKHDPSHIETRPISPTGHVETFVERAYRVILNRSGDPEGIAHWDALLASGTSAGEIIAEFFRSDEFRARSLTSEQTVTLCYEAMMDRLPEPEGLANWTAVLDDGYSTTKLVAEFVESDEFQELCDAFGLTAGTIALPARDENSNITRFVLRCYEFALRREADEAGLNEFCEKLLNKTATPEEVAFMFVFSDEAHALWNGNSTFMTMLYRLMLDREPDLGGLENWVAALDAAEDASSKDEGRQQVFQLFAESDEFALMISNFVF